MNQSGAVQEPEQLRTCTKAKAGTYDANGSASDSWLARDLHHHRDGVGRHGNHQGSLSASGIVALAQKPDVQPSVGDSLDKPDGRVQLLDHFLLDQNQNRLEHRNRNREHRVGG